MRDRGQIDPSTPVRTVIWKLRTGGEQEEIIIAGRYETIAQQEAEFRQVMSPVAEFITPFDPSATVQAKNWVAELRGK